MEADERIVKYMKVRNDHARCVACVVAVQLFALAVYFCLYALIAGGAFYSLSQNTGKVAIISVSAVIAVILCVVNILTVIRSKKVYITRPDSVSLREAHDVVKIAYTTARPVLIYKITYSLVLLTLGGIVYIILNIIMENSELSVYYGRIAVCLIAAVFVLIAYPCIDRIGCYRDLLNETHRLYFDIKPNKPLMYILSVAVPLAVFLWYVLRFFGNRQEISWIVFPLFALFGLAIAFLANSLPEKR